MPNENIIRNPGELTYAYNQEYKDNKGSYALYTLYRLIYHTVSLRYAYTSEQTNWSGLASEAGTDTFRVIVGYMGLITHGQDVRVDEDFAPIQTFIDHLESIGKQIPTYTHLDMPSFETSYAQALAELLKYIKDCDYDISYLLQQGDSIMNGTFTE